MQPPTTGWLRSALNAALNTALSATLIAVLVSSTAAASAETVAVRILAINDFHGHIEPGENAIAVPDPEHPDRTLLLRVGGAAWLATWIAKLRAEQPNHVVVSSGDLVGASPLASGLFYDEPTIQVMNAIGLDMGAVGNHEFDRGTDELMRLARGGCHASAMAPRTSCAGAVPFTGASFPLLASNVIDRRTLQPLLATSIVRTFDGVKIGFIGAVTRSTPGIVPPGGVAGVRFLPEATAINEVAAKLQAQGVRTLVVVIHEGGDADGGFNECSNPRGAIFDIARALDPSISVILSAHTHRGYRCVIDGRTVIQGASFGRLISVVDIEIDRATGEALRERTRAINIPVANGLAPGSRINASYPAPAPDARVEAIVARYRELAAPLANRPVGRIAQSVERRPTAGGDHALGRLIADAQLAATRNHGAQIALTNPGGVRTDLRASGTDGIVTYADAFSVQPFGNGLVTLTLTGAQLRLLLEQQWSAADRARILQPSKGFSYAWSAARARGQRVIADSMRLNGAVIDPAASYRITVNDFLATGGDGFRVLREGTDRTGGGLDIDAFVTFLSSESVASPLNADTVARVRRLP
ncbi:MAG: bifunctional metallophosphatase/5'-nucleotidase [Burkholderiaceae bacterium]